jgi:hypothetical protein
MTEEYAVSEDINTLPESNAWTTLNNAKGQWDAEMPVLWNRETIAYTQGKPSDVKVHILALWAEDGRSLTNIENWYKTSANSSETAGGVAQGWQKDTPSGLQFDDVKPYLWNYEKLIFSDGSFQTTTPAIKSIFSRGARGATLRGPSMWEAGKTYYFAIRSYSEEEIIINVTLGCAHSYTDGVCDICGAVCDHSVADVSLVKVCECGSVYKGNDIACGDTFTVVPDDEKSCR